LQVLGRKQGLCEYKQPNNQGKFGVQHK
jgi:hypothetical protein